jgi:FixJ family two-component response regulator
MIKSAQAMIFIVDDEEIVRRGLSLLLRSAGYSVETFSSVADFLAMDAYVDAGCILLDIFMGSESGLDLQETVTGRFTNLPVIYMSGHGSIGMSVHAIKKGAINFLSKPFEDLQLFEAVEEALAKSMEIIKNRREMSALKTMVDSLTSREVEIFMLVITGMLNKQIAGKLNIAEHTVKLHRGRITEKLGVKSVAELVLIAERLNLK